MTMPSAKPATLGLGENRKASKPLIEKRRRARINNSLAQLKSMVVGSVTNNQNGKPPKLEKADILEMTVAHLKKIQHGLMKAPDDEKYLAGFSYCLKEVRHFIESNVDDDSKTRVLNYLSNFSSKFITPGGNQTISDLETGMDDSSCSSTSRSETPSSTFNECLPMDYNSCSPCSENQPDSSSLSPVNQMQYENTKWSYASPDTSANILQTTRTCSNNVPNNCERNIAPNMSNGPLNLSYHNSKSNVDHKEHNEQYQGSRNVQINYSRENANNHQFYNDDRLQGQLLMPNINQGNPSEPVWRPW